MSTGLVIAGAPGVGKTTASRALAEQLGWPCVDLDALVRARVGRSPAEIISSDGEARFRVFEAEALEGLGAEPAVIALGGGTLTTPKARKLARELGPVVGLELDRDTLLNRIRGDSGAPRPLLVDGLDQLLEARAGTYAAVDRRVSAHGSAEEVARRIRDATRDLRMSRARFLELESRIMVGRGLRSAVVGAVANLEPTRPILFIEDLGVPASKRDALAESLSPLARVTRYATDGGEACKTWEKAGEILAHALSEGCGRQSVVVVLGGGATCDLGNLVAHLLGRGAPTVLVPSTLLSQVDASVGGKCAVNHAGQRNSVGAFHAPAEVVIDLDLLDSLDPDELRSGLAEMVKAGVIGAPDLFERLEAGETPSPDLVSAAVIQKAGVVARDPLEAGERKHLNLGHTLGHALEAASGFGLRHGDAVAMGLAAAARASAQLGHCAPEVAQRIIALLEQLGLPTRAAPELLEGARSHFSADKKADARSLEWIVVRRIGEVAGMRETSEEVGARLVELGG